MEEYFDLDLYDNTVDEIVEILGNYILNNIALHVNGINFRIREVEFYYLDDEHNDEYVHKSKDQLKSKSWYFHKYKNGTLKTGTWKGLDITVGNNVDKYCGILIRSMESDNEFITGSCTCVKRILQEFGFTESQGLIDMMKDMNIFNKRNPIYLHQIDECNLPIYTGPRVGLSLKYPEYLFRPYRLLKKPDKIPKGRDTLIATLYSQGYTIDEIRIITGGTKASINKNIKLFDNRKESDNLIEFYGYCMN